MKINKYTPIKCYKTNIALKLGDFVEDLQKRCGTLEWCDVFNEYYIKTIDSGKIKTQSYIKIRKPYTYKIDNTRIECRSNYLKQKY